VYHPAYMDPSSHRVEKHLCIIRPIWVLYGQQWIIAVSRGKIDRQWTTVDPVWVHGAKAIDD
jgi:hypothetical protein